MAVSSEHPAGSDCGHIEVLEDRHGATALRWDGKYWRTGYPGSGRLMVLANFPAAVLKYPGKSSLREGVFI